MPRVIDYEPLRALCRFKCMQYEGRSLDKRWLEKLKIDCTYRFQIPYKGLPIYEPVLKAVVKMIHQKGLTTCE